MLRPPVMGAGRGASDGRLGWRACRTIRGTPPCRRPRPTGWVSTNRVRRLMQWSCPRNRSIPLHDGGQFFTAVHHRDIRSAGTSGRVREIRFRPAARCLRIRESAARHARRTTRNELDVSARARLQAALRCPRCLYASAQSGVERAAVSGCRGAQPSSVRGGLPSRHGGAGPPCQSPGSVIAAGTTQASNSSALSRPEASAASRSVIPRAWAVLAMAAAAS